jgi:orotate phosphoribosyltransferase
MTDTAASDRPRSALRTAVLELIRDKGLRHFDEPLQLSSGEYSQDFIDAKLALAQGDDLATACRAMAEIVADAGVEFDAVGGLTLGADQFAHGVAIVAGKGWFVIRKQPKGRGTDQWVEGTPLGPGVRVLLVDDIVTTGGSIQKAHERVEAEGAEVVFAITTVDRGEVARKYFEERNVPYEPLLTYKDLAIPPVGGAPASA